MTKAGDEAALLLDAAARGERVEDRPPQFGDSLAGERRNRKRVAIYDSEVTLIAGDQALALGALDQATILRAERHGNIDHYQGQVCVRHRLVTTLDSQALHQILAFANARSVNEFHRDSVERRG